MFLCFCAATVLCFWINSGGADVVPNGTLIFSEPVPYPFSLDVLRSFSQHVVLRNKRAVTTISWSYSYQITTSSLSVNSWYVTFTAPLGWNYYTGQSFGTVLNQNAMMRASQSTFTYDVISYVGQRPNLDCQVNSLVNGGLDGWYSTVRVDNCFNAPCHVGGRPGCSIGLPYMSNGVCTRVLSTTQSPGLQYEIYSGQQFAVYQITPYTQYTITMPSGILGYCQQTPLYVDCGTWTPFRVHSYGCDKVTQNCKYTLTSNWVVAFQNKATAVILPSELIVPVAQKVTRRLGVNTPDYFWLVKQAYHYLSQANLSPNYALFSALCNSLYQQSATLSTLCFGSPFFVAQECYNNALYLPDAVFTTLFSTLFSWDYQINYPLNQVLTQNETFLQLPATNYQGQTLSQGRMLNLFKDAIVFLDFFDTKFYRTNDAPSSDIFVVVARQAQLIRYGNFRIEQINGYFQVKCSSNIISTLEPHPAGVIMIARHHSMWSVAARNSTSFYCVTHSLTTFGKLDISTSWFFHTLALPSGPVSQVSMPLLSTAAVGVYMHPMIEHWIPLLTLAQSQYQPSFFNIGINKTITLTTQLQAYAQVYTAWFLSVIYVRLPEARRLTLGVQLVPFIQALLSIKQADLDATDVDSVARYNVLSLMWGRKYAVVNYNQLPEWTYPLFKGEIGESMWFRKKIMPTTEGCQTSAHFSSITGYLQFSDYVYIPKYNKVSCPISTLAPSVLQVYEVQSLFVILIQCVSGSYDWYPGLSGGTAFVYKSYKLGTVCVLLPSDVLSTGPNIGFYSGTALSIVTVQTTNDVLPNCIGLVQDNIFTPCHPSGCPVRNSYDNYIVCFDSSTYTFKNYHRTTPPVMNVPIQEVPLQMEIPTVILQSYELKHTESVLLQDIEGGIIVDHNTGSIWYPDGQAYDVSFYVSVIIRYAPPKLELPSTLANFTSCLDYICFGNYQCRTEAQTFCTSMDYFEQVFNKSLISLKTALQDLHYVLKLVLPETTLELTELTRRRRRAVYEFDDTISLLSESFERFMSPASQAYMANMLWWDDAFDGFSLPQRTGSILSRSPSLSSVSSWNSYTSRTPLISNVKTPKTTFNVKLSMPKLPKASTLSKIGSVLSSGLSIASLGLSIFSIVEDRRVTELTQQQIMALEDQITILTDYTEKNFKEIQSSLNTLGQQVQDFSQQVTMSLQQLSNGLEQITQQLDKSIYYVTATQQYATYMSSLINHLTELAAAVYKTQDMYVTCIHSLQSGVLSPNCITPSQIFQLYQVARNLSGQCQPIFSEREVSRFYSLPLVTDAMVHNDTYWFSWSIPITCSNIQGSVYKVQPGYIVNPTHPTSLQYDLPSHVVTSNAGALRFDDHYCDRYNQVYLCTKSAFDLQPSNYLTMLYSNISENVSLTFHPEPRPDPCVYLSSSALYCYYSDQCNQCVVAVGNCSNQTVTYRNYTYPIMDPQCRGFDQITISSPIDIGVDFTALPSRPPLPLHLSYVNVTFNVTIPHGLNWTDLVLDYSFKDKIYEISKNITDLHQQILQVSSWASGWFQRIRDFLYNLLPTWITWLTLGFSLFSIVISGINIILFFEMNGKVKKS
ncbi:precursor polypeptide (AA -19 to 1562) [Berne virus]|uniref:Spike glycoprotein n=2 Tax=Berne virus TaxID=11156 RepID=SPIKE_BEV|nr:precursor polypeptide (AA -19 to 1562) [Berne virus]P23052.1 RecName: Full=Spike glycoprotein; Short=S glycoprotein; AltName: Full=E2; AltName: Full=Peplomer protein; Flags: Precursor [Berne virus]CAA36748.1 precursor polypeptide (AA -19 to 1562) [Berne virus]